MINASTRLSADQRQSPSADSNGWRKVLSMLAEVQVKKAG
jgi:hypothetical protein